MFMEGGCPGASDWQWVPGSRGFVGRNLTHSCCTTAGVSVQRPRQPLAASGWACGIGATF